MNVRSLCMILAIYIVICSHSSAQDFEFDEGIAREFSQLIFRDFFKSFDANKKEKMANFYDTKLPITGTFIDHSNRRFVFVIYPETNGKGSFMVVAEICSGYGSVFHEYHLSDQGMTAMKPNEVVANFKAMKNDPTSDLPLACPCDHDFEQP